MKLNAVEDNTDEQIVGEAKGSEESDVVGEADGAEEPEGAAEALS